MLVVVVEVVLVLPSWAVAVATAVGVAILYVVIEFWNVDLSTVLLYLKCPLKNLYQPKHVLPQKLLKLPKNATILHVSSYFAVESVKFSLLSYFNFIMHKILYFVNEKAAFWEVSFMDEFPQFGVRFKSFQFT